MEFEMTVKIDRRVDEVFAFLSDLANDPRWRREWADAKRASGSPIGVGTTTPLFSRAGGRGMKAVYEVSEFEPGRSVKWKTVAGPLPLVFWRSVQAVQGGTLVKMGYSGEFRGVFAILLPLLKLLGRRALAGDLPRLKVLLESGES